MSKIFDALRKAEMNRGRARRKKSDARPINRDAARENAFIRGMDEDFRRSLMNLRNSIDSEMKDVSSRTIMFSSAVSNEGKTTIVAYLARILALGESSRILIIDCAVADPQLHRLFGVQNEKGILDYLAGDAQLAEIIMPLEEGILDLITTGPVRSADVTQPLFNSGRMNALFDKLSEHYDYILIDTSAILETPETPIIGSRVAGTVLIVRAGRTKREVVKRAIMMVEKLNGRFIGTVLNRKRYYIPDFIYRRV